MLASRVNLLMALSLALGLSGCYGYHVPPASPYGGYGGACTPYGDYGYGGYGYGAYGDGGYGDGGYGYGNYDNGNYDYGGYGTYGQAGYRAYGDCVAPGGADYGDYAYPHRRAGVRERLHARRDTRRDRHEGRRRHGPHRRHHGRHGDIGCDGGGCDGGGCDCCGGDFGYDQCGQCFDCCESCVSCGGDCTSCMESSASWDGSAGCESCQSGMIDSGMIDSGMMGSGMMGSGMMSSPSPTCAGGSCQRGAEWQDGTPTFVPYSHEGSPTEAAPYPIDGSIRESLPVPPSELNVPEGDFGPADGESSVIRSPQALAPVNQTRWVPPQF